MNVDLDSLAETITFNEVKPDIQVNPYTNDEMKNIFITWTIGEDQAELLVSLHPPFLEFFQLIADQPLQRQNLFSLLSARLPAWARNHDVKWFIVNSHPNDAAHNIFLNAGYSETYDGMPATNVEEEDASKVEQYGKWKLGERDEPDWHKKARSLQSSPEPVPLTQQATEDRSPETDNVIPLPPHGYNPDFSHGLPWTKPVGSDD